MPRVVRGTVCVYKGERATWHFFREDPTGRRRFRERNEFGGMVNLVYTWVW